VILAGVLLNEDVSPANCNRFCDCSGTSESSEISISNPATSQFHFILSLSLTLSYNLHFIHSCSYQSSIAIPSARRVDLCKTLGRSKQRVSQDFTKMNQKMLANGHNIVVLRIRLTKASPNGRQLFKRCLHYPVWF